MANSLPKHKPDYRLWVDTVEDIKLLVDEANNYADPRVTIGTIIYAAEEDQYYSIKGNNHKVSGYEVLKTNSENIFFGNKEPNIDKNAKSKALWVVDSDDVSTEEYIHGYFPEDNIITSLKNRVGELEKQVKSLMAIIQYGAIAGDSTIGGRTSIMGMSPVCTNPTTDEDEPTDDGSIKPSELLATVPNFSIKHDTIENFKKNYQNLINGELIWIRNGENINVGDPGLYMYAANKLYVGFISLASGSGNAGGSGGSGSLVTIEVKDDGILDILSNKTSVNSDGILIIDDTENFNVDDNGILNIKGIKSDEDITTPDKPEVEDPIKGEVKDNILNITSTAKLFIEDGVLIINDSNVVEDGVIKL